MSLTGMILLRFSFLSQMYGRDNRDELTPYSRNLPITP